MADARLSTLTLKQSLDGLQEKKFSAGELQAAVLESIRSKNEDLNVYLAHRDAPVGEITGPLAGIPLAVKDNFLTTDLITTASSNVLRDYQPHYESTVTRKLRSAGAWIVGKTNMDAWAHGSSTETSDFGPTKNPNNPDYIPGGSSGGSGAAVAADMCTAAIGSETAGSIRGPASWCGVVGLKPTYGRVSRYGVVAMGSSLDSPGVMTKTTEDAALLLQHIVGQDKYDGTTSTQSVDDYATYLGKSVKELKIGAIYFDVPGIDDAALRGYKAAVEAIRSLGAQVKEVKAMDPQHAIGLYAVIQRSEVSSNLARYDGIRYGQDRSHFGEEAKKRIMVGTYTLSKGYADKYYVQAQKVRTLYIQDFARLFSQYDLLVAPTAPGLALKLGDSKNYPYFGELMDLFLEASSIAGLPAMSVPCWRDENTNLPLGLNIMAPFWQEGKMIQLADAFEKSTQWNLWRQA